MFDTSRGLLNRAGVSELDEQDEAERQHGEFMPYVAADAPVYSAADKAGVVPELRGLLASRAAPEVLATVLSRRLGRQVLVEAPNGDVPLPLLRWASGGGVSSRDQQRPTKADLQGSHAAHPRSAEERSLGGWTTDDGERQ